MDNPAGCPHAHPQAVGCPQAPQGHTTTSRIRQDKKSKALHRAQTSRARPPQRRRLPTSSNRPHPYNQTRATQQPTGIGHVAEIAGHVRRNTHEGLRRVAVSGRSRCGRPSFWEWQSGLEGRAIESVVVGRARARGSHLAIAFRGIDLRRDGLAGRDEVLDDSFVDVQVAFVFTKVPDVVTLG